MGTVAVDFDGVIHAYSKGWQGGEIYDGAVPGSFDAIQKLLDDGYAVMIHTTREPMTVAAWMRRVLGLDCTYSTDESKLPEFWTGPSILVTRRKLPALAYIDDRAIRFTSWDQALADLAEVVA